MTNSRRRCATSSPSRSRSRRSRVVHEAESRDGTIKVLFDTGGRTPGRGGAHALPRRPPLALPVLAVGLPADLHVLRDGPMKFGRNLTASEILDQALHFRRIEGSTTVVFMGMGEPMMNLDHVLAACRRLPDLGVTHRRTAISTVGWLPGIERLADEPTADPPRALACTPPRTRCARRSCRSTSAIRWPTSRRLPALVRAQAPQGVHRVRDARRRQRLLRAGRRARRACWTATSSRSTSSPTTRPADLRGLLTGGDRGVPRRARGARACRSPSASPAAATSTRRAASSPRARLATVPPPSPPPLPSPPLTRTAARANGRCVLPRARMCSRWPSPSTAAVVPGHPIARCSSGPQTRAASAIGAVAVRAVQDVAAEEHHVAGIGLGLTSRPAYRAPPRQPVDRLVGVAGAGDRELAESVVAVAAAVVSG